MVVLFLVVRGVLLRLVVLVGFFWGILGVLLLVVWVGMLVVILVVLVVVLVVLLFGMLVVDME